MKLFNKRREQPTEQQGIRFPFAYKSLVIDHPLFDTDMEGIVLQLENKIPKDAILTEGDKIKPILIYRPGIESDTLIPVSKAGAARLFIKSRIKGKLGTKKLVPYDLEKDWYFLTVKYIYTDPASGVVTPKVSEKKETPQTVDQFIDDIGSGKVWDTTTDMGPYQLGQDLELPEVDRLLRRARQQKLAQNLYNSIKTLSWCVLGSLVLFGIILISRG